MQWRCPTALAFVVVLGGCAAEVEYQPAYLASAIPRYLADTRILILMDPEDMEYVYEGAADSFIGSDFTLRMPIGAITREIAVEVFQRHFNYGVVFAGSPPPDVRYVVAIDPAIRGFTYRYEQLIEDSVIEMRTVDGGIEAIPATIITPTIEFELALKAYDFDGNVILDKIYPSGVVAGESYYVTSRPHERINATFHATLQSMMLRVASDLRAFLAEQPNVLYTE
jgi:hypothetical protein